MESLFEAEQNADRHLQSHATGLRAMPKQQRCDQPMAASRMSTAGDESPVWVGYCRPRTSAVRSLSLGVSFPAVRSSVRPALADPNPPVGLLQSCPTLGQDYFGLRVYESAVRDHREPARSGY